MSDNASLTSIGVSLLVGALVMASSPVQQIMARYQPEPIYIQAQASVMPQKVASIEQVVQQVAQGASQAPMPQLNEIDQMAAEMSRNKLPLVSPPVRRK